MNWATLWHMAAGYKNTLDSFSICHGTWIKCSHVWLPAALKYEYGFVSDGSPKKKTTVYRRNLSTNLQLNWGYIIRFTIRSLECVHRIESNQITISIIHKCRIDAQIKRSSLYHMNTCQSFQFRFILFTVNCEILNTHVIRWHPCYPFKLNEGRWFSPSLNFYMACEPRNNK